MSFSPSEFPLPSEEALTASRALTRLIVEDIQSQTGWISFARYMQLALYTPKLGYYSGGSRKFGEEGDFVTAPELTPLFGQALTVQLEQIMHASEPYILEVGAGTGILAADILQTLEARGALPLQYRILEVSGELRARQLYTLQEKVPHLVDKVCWLEKMPELITGCILANEVLDVMPVHRVVWCKKGLFERGVGEHNGQLVEIDRPAQGHVLSAMQDLPILLADMEEEYVTEICPAACAWVAQWEPCLKKGALLLIDYGYPRSEFYLPERTAGTIQCYYRHRAHTDLLRWPGLNDITAFVDFTTIAQAAFDAGLSVLGYITQANFLHNCGLLDLLAKRGEIDSPEYLRAARVVNRLIGSHDMGELFKVLALGKNLDIALIGFSQGDRVYAL